MNNTTDPLGNMTTMFDVNDYKCANKGLLLPLVNEYTWSIGGRAFIYILGLLWCFLAVAIIADVFMCSIERITSKTTKVRIPDSEEPEGFRIVEVRVWNSTVANLSLLALGTSAPEILLSLIETLGNGFKAGQLGPGTIVGSAAFNLLVISGICVMSIPSPDIRRLANMKVFIVTAVSGVFAYVWMVIVLMVISPNRVESWEAAVTLLFFPLLIGIAYLADRDFCMKKAEEQPTGEVGFSLVSDEETGDRRASKREKHSDASLMALAKDLGHDVRDGELHEDEAAKLVAAKLAEGQSHSRGWYRVNATRMLSGGRKLVPHVLDQFQELYNTIQKPAEERTGTPRTVDHSAGNTKAVLEFTAAGVSVMENVGKVRIGIKRSGRLDVPCSVRVETINGTALQGEDYITFKETVSFGANECLRQIYIEIVDDCEWEPDEFFFVKLSVLDENAENIAIGNVAINQVTIINDDEPGKLEFAKPSLVVKESYSHAKIPVNRINGGDGHVSVKWSTKDITAIAGKDYVAAEGTLVFDNQEISKIIEIELLPTDKKERDECFQLTLGETDGGADLAKITKSIVTIVNDDEFNGIVSRLINLTKGNLDSLSLESSTWLSQFKEAMNVNGGDIEGATFVDYIMHFLTFGWKIIFAFIPPAKYLGGWPTFLISLAVIGLLTAIIGDLAGIFGCLINLPDAITAITLVALGTSMPDTFASKTAAISEKTADSSVGNVNGSNSVNVFLGLGLPWIISSIYWESKGQEFTVDAGSVAFSVVVFTICAVTALTILMIRRFFGVFGNAELGGPKVPKIVSGIVLISLWFIYVTLSSLKSLNYITFLG